MSAYTGQVPDTRRAADWRATAACARPEYADRRDLWFPHTTDKADTAEAKEVCGMCPVRRACLVAALREEGGVGVDSRFGIRGGATAGERVVMYRKYRTAQAAVDHKTN